MIPTQLDLSLLLKQLKPLTAHANKYTQGHVFIIGGDQGMSGSALLSALGALRSGAGLVSVATHPDHAAHLNMVQPEIMCHGVELEDSMSSSGSTGGSPSKLHTLIQKATAIVIGPGTTPESTWSQHMIQAAFKANKPLIIDAGALRYLANQKNKKPKNAVLTPHEGEAAPLLGRQTATVISNDREQAALDLHAKYNAVIALKGPNTLIISPDKKMSFSPYGNPGMASGGMGDLLSGMIGAFVAQGNDLTLSTQTAVCLHAKAADIAAKNGMRGMVATDLLPVIQQLLG